MLWQHTYADQVHDRRQRLASEAAQRRMQRSLPLRPPAYREWIARQLVVLALRLAPSARLTLRSLLRDEGSLSTPPASPTPSRPYMPLA
jgi:hypothetical protein